MRILLCISFVLSLTLTSIHSKAQESLELCAVLKRSKDVKVRFGTTKLFRGEAFLVGDRKAFKQKLKRSKRKSRRSRRSRRKPKVISKYKLFLGNEAVWISEKDLNLVTSKECENLQKPAVARSQALLYKDPKENSPRVGPKQVYTPVSYLKRRKSQYYRVYFENKYYLINNEQLRFKFNRDDLKNTKGGLFTVFGFHFDMAAGVTSLNNQSDYEDMVTEIPDVLDVSQLQDPILTDITSGSGFQISGIITWPKSYKNNHRLEIAYAQGNYTYNGLSNPNTSTTTYAELVDKEEKELKTQYLEFTYHWNRTYWSSQVAHYYYGVGGKFKYLLSPASVTVKADCETASCTLGKRDDMEVESSSSQTELLLSLTAGYSYKRWRFWMELDSDLNAQIKTSFELF